jgi:RND family efflux transporter MFP subunit
MRALHIVIAALGAGLACSGSPGGGAPVRRQADTATAVEQRTPGSQRVELSEAAIRAAGIQVESVTAVSPAAVEALALPGEVQLDPRRVALISPRLSGRLEELLAVEGEQVARGQVVARLTSPEYLTAQSDLIQASGRARVLQGTSDETGATAIAEAARRRLTLLGVSDGEIARLESGGEPRLRLELTAPFTGSLLEPRALPGQVVEAGAPIYKLADRSEVDVIAQVPERALPFVRVGQRATVTIAAFPDIRFGGHVERLHQQLNPETRTVEAVIHTLNPRGALRPGMFATVTLSVPMAASARAGGRAMVVVPEAAVLMEGEARHVFVEVGPRTFESRRVTVSSVLPPGASGASPGIVAVRSGLAVGERVVVRGAFTLKSELAKASLAEEE